MVTAVDAATESVTAMTLSAILELLVGNWSAQSFADSASNALRVRAVDGRMQRGWWIIEEDKRRMHDAFMIQLITDSATARQEKR